MSKEDELKNYFSRNTDKTSTELICNVMRKFDVTKNTASKYFYEWKKEYMRSNTCVPKVKALEKTNFKKLRNTEKILVVENNEYGKAIKGEYIDYIIRKNGIEVDNMLFKSWKDLEKYREHAKKQLAELEKIMRGTGNY